MKKENAKKIVVMVDDKNGVRLGIITSEGYGSSMSYFILLMTIALEDFPGLTPDQIQVKRYTGRFNNKKSGLEFPIPQWQKVPDGYVEMEMSLARKEFPV